MYCNHDFGAFTISPLISSEKGNRLCSAGSGGDDICRNVNAIGNTFKIKIVAAGTYRSAKLTVTGDSLKSVEEVSEDD